MKSCLSMKSCRWCGAVGVLTFLGTLAQAADQAELVPIDKPPAAISEMIAASLNPQGQQVRSGKQSLCTVWLAKELPLKPDFKSTLSVKYPLIPGQLVGVLEVIAKSDFTDFRGQEVAAGVYTLRYGQQPVDGNHVGTSELADFLLAIPAKLDEDPSLPKTSQALFKLSAKATGSNHPAIYSLLPPKASEKTPTVIRDTAKDFLILNLSTSGKSGDQTTVVPLRLIIVGHSEG